MNIGEYDSEKAAAAAVDLARVWQILKGQLGYTWQEVRRILGDRARQHGGQWYGGIKRRWWSAMRL